MDRKKKTRWLIVLSVVLATVLVMMATTALAVSEPTTTYSFQTDWNGVNGAGFNLPGAGLHWVLGTGGSGGITAGELWITYSDGTRSGPFSPDTQGGLSFDTPGVPGLTITAARVYYTAPAASTSPLTISHTNTPEETTTTTEEETTTTVEEESSTTTTEEETTTTTEEETTTTTEEETTTTTEEETTTTTEEETTTTTEEETTTTTEEETTTTTEEETTTTTEEETTTTTTEEVTTTTLEEESSTTTTEEEETTTTVGDITTVTAIQTGAGGTAAPSNSLWALGIFALALAGGLVWTALRPVVKRR